MGLESWLVLLGWALYTGFLLGRSAERRRQARFKPRPHTWVTIDSDPGELLRVISSGGSKPK